MGCSSVSRSFSRYLPTGGSSRPIGLTFGSDAQIGQVWNTSPALALTITRNPTDKTRPYWRAVTYDKIEPRVWSTSTTTTTDRAAGTSLFEGLVDTVDPATHHTFDFTVTPADYREPEMISPATPVSVDEATRLKTVGTTGRFASLVRAGGSESYTVSALLPVYGNGPGELNEEALREDSTTYPDDIKALYLDPGQALGPESLKVEAKILSLAASNTPYDIASAAVKELQSSDFHYAVDIRDVNCGALSTVECFATFKKGFCQYYAATMAVILRDLGIPTRIAQGFLPGTRDASGATERIQNNNAHAWVEVFFPTYGWVEFDPTSPEVAQLAPLPSGPPAASAKPKPSVSFGPRASLGLRGETDTGPSGSFNGPGKASHRTAHRRRVPAPDRGRLGRIPRLAARPARADERGGRIRDGHPDRVPASVSRRGPPRPCTSTPTSLGQVLPDVRPELQIVARAKVETTYARHLMSEERLAGSEGGTAAAARVAAPARVPTQGTTPPALTLGRYWALRAPLRSRSSACASGRRSRSTSSGGEVSGQVVRAQDRRARRGTRRP